MIFGSVPFPIPHVVTVSDSVSDSDSVCDSVIGRSRSRTEGGYVE